MTTGKTVLAASAPDPFGDLVADEGPVRFPDSDVLGAAHVDGLEKLHASVMEGLSVGGEGKEGGKGRKWRREGEEEGGG